MAAFYKTLTPPGAARSDARFIDRRPPLLLDWRLGPDGRPIARWLVRGL